MRVDAIDIFLLQQSLSYSGSFFKHTMENISEATCPSKFLIRQKDVANHNTVLSVEGQVEICIFAAVCFLCPSLFAEIFVPLVNISKKT